ncbi:MAG: VWA domain-containing protein, partial [Candidatus Parabeggiatoa sp.]|nr:VWA domain-containing protein [Candidatus Parabeggiatoa sp.]
RFEKRYHRYAFVLKRPELAYQDDLQILPKGRSGLLSSPADLQIGSEKEKENAGNMPDVEQKLKEKKAKEKEARSNMKEIVLPKLRPSTTKEKSKGSRETQEVIENINSGSYSIIISRDTIPTSLSDLKYSFYLPEMKQLPHNGLFIRRNNAFGTKLTTSLKEIIAQGVMIEQDKIRFDDFVAMNTDGIPLPNFNNALAVSHGIAAIPDYQKRDERATHYLEIALKTADIAPSGHPEAKAPPVNYVFVIDTSGSMRKGGKLDTVKASIRELFNNMKADDVIGIIAFHGEAKTVLESIPKKEIAPDEFGKIINSLTPDGGTDINLGLSFGLNEINRHSGSHKVNHLFLFSDGKPTSGEENWIKIRQNIADKTRGNIRLSTFAFGTDASRTELDKLAGITGGQSTFVIEPEDVKHNLQQELDKRTHLAAMNVQMQIEIDPDIYILHLYGHDLITDSVSRAAVLRDIEDTKLEIEKEHGIKSQADIVTDDKGIRIFIPNLAIGETYWVVFELAVPEQRQQSALGKATVQYMDTFARQNEKYQFNLSPKGQIASKWVAQHALGLWTSEVAFYALDDLYEDNLYKAEKRIKHYISVLEFAKDNLASEQLADDIITLNKFISLAQNLGKRKGISDIPQVRSYFVHELNKFGRVRNGFVQKVNYGK